MAYTVGIAAALFALSVVPASQPHLQWLSIFALGFCIYGPQMLIGLCGAELVAPAAVGASQGLLGWIAYLGAANAGVPLSMVVQNYGWAGYFSTLMAACGMALLLLAPLAGARSHIQKRAAGLVA
jgi:OPA family sugar phosphate sensor protein UhpC-like MFS transporter